MGKDGLAGLFGGGATATPTYDVPMSMADQSSPFAPWAGGSPGALPGQTTGTNAGGGMNWGPVASALGGGAADFAAGQSPAGMPQGLRANNATFKAPSLMPAGSPPSFDAPTQLQQISTPAEGTIDRVQKSLGYRAIPPTTYRPIPLTSEVGKVFRAKRYRT